MLYDYHKYQNGLRADSVHATYLVFGTKTAEDAQGDGDVEMASSMPEPEALSEDAPTATLTIVAEEKLNGRPHFAHSIYQTSHIKPRYFG